MRSHIITSEIANVTITKIVTDGAMVKAGDTLVCFDQSQLEARWKSQRNQLDVQISKLAQQKENITLTEFQGGLAVKQAVYQLEYAKAKLEESRANLVQEQELFVNKFSSYPDVQTADLAAKQTLVTKIFELTKMGGRSEFCSNQIVPGMTASVEILVDALPNALYVPLEAAIQEEDSLRVLYVMSNSKPEKVVTKFGIWNENNIVVVGGIKAGDLVCIRDPALKLTALESQGLEDRTTQGPTLGP